jgi:hypothetical protein
MKKLIHVVNENMSTGTTRANSIFFCLLTTSIPFFLVGLTSTLKLPVALQSRVHRIKLVKIDNQTIREAATGSKSSIREVVWR